MYNVVRFADVYGACVFENIGHFSYFLSAPSW